MLLRQLSIEERDCGEKITPGACGEYFRMPTILLCGDQNRGNYPRKACDEAYALSFPTELSMDRLALDTMNDIQVPSLRREEAQSVQAIFASYHVVCSLRAVLLGRN